MFDADLVFDDAELNLNGILCHLLFDLLRLVVVAAAAASDDDASFPSDILRCYDYCCYCY